MKAAFWPGMTFKYSPAPAAIGILLVVAVGFEPITIAPGADHLGPVAKG
jgi:hypothetical protein